MIKGTAKNIPKKLFNLVIIVQVKIIKINPKTAFPLLLFGILVGTAEKESNCLTVFLLIII
jgi:hypothetical protein